MQTAIISLPIYGLARTINEAHAEVQLAAKSMLFAAKRAGEALLQAKQGLPHGSFQAWVEANTQISHSQAKRYMTVAKKLVGKPFDPALADASIEAFLGYEKKLAAAPSFTRDDAEYALKIHARATRGDGGEREVAQRKLEKLAKDHGLTAEEMVKKAEGLCPEEHLTKTEASNQALRTEILAPFQALSKGELLDVIFELILKMAKR